MTFLLLIFFYSMKPMYLDVTEWSTFPRFYSVQAAINMHNSSLDFEMYFSFFIQQITCVTDRARCFDLSGKFSNSLFIIFAIPLEQCYWFFKAKHHQKNPPTLSFHLRRSSLHPSRYSSFIHLSPSARIWHY